jgi:hypothetical protein
VVTVVAMTMAVASAVMTVASAVMTVASAVRVNFYDIAIAATFDKWLRNHSI